MRSMKSQLQIEVLRAKSTMLLAATRMLTTMWMHSEVAFSYEVERTVDEAIGRFGITKDDADDMREALEMTAEFEVVTVQHEGHVLFSHYTKETRKTIGDNVWSDFTDPKTDLAYIRECLVKKNINEQRFHDEELRGLIYAIVDEDCDIDHGEGWSRQVFMTKDQCMGDEVYLMVKTK